MPRLSTLTRLSSLIAFAAVLSLVGGCAGVSESDRPPGTERCESFFIYALCVSDLDSNGEVDFMYFDDTKEIFMHAAGELDKVSAVLPLHPCAIAMSESTRRYSSRLLYGDDLALSERLALKGKLINNYRKSQPAVNACQRHLTGTPPATVDDPFLVQEDWPGDEF